MSVKKIKSIIDKKQDLLDLKNVVGVGVGYKTTKGKKTSELSLVVSVEKKVSANNLKAEEIIPEQIDGYPTDVVEAGKIVAQGTRDKHRPAPGGVSVGHYFITAGTLGMWVEKDGVPHILSNNHILADSNKGKIGDNILQPAPSDRGNNPDDLIAVLADYVRIDFGYSGRNVVDAAIARIPGEGNGNGGGICPFGKKVVNSLNFLYKIFNRKHRFSMYKPISADELVLNEILDIGKIVGLQDARLEQSVRKSGRTTGLTVGTVTQLHATVRVDYGEEGIATFYDQIITTDMSKGGDSGSIIVDSNELNAVGLLFAGSSTVTVANRIQDVFSKLNIKLLS